MKLEKWNEVVDFIKDFKIRKEELEKKITNTGDIPDDIIERANCQKLEQIKELEEEKETVKAFVEWYNDNNVEEFSYTNSIHSNKRTAYVEYRKEGDDSESETFPHTEKIKQKNKLGDFFSNFASSSRGISIENGLNLSDRDIEEKARKKVTRWRGNRRPLTAIRTGDTESELIFCTKEYK